MKKIIDLNSARKMGLKYYFTGMACKRGHVSDRYTKKRACVECVREDSYARSQTEKVKMQNKAYKQTEEYKSQQKEYKSRDDVKAAESRNQSKRRAKQIEKYLKKERESASRNKEKRNQYCRNHYYENKGYYRKKQKEFTNKNPSYFQEKCAERRSRIKSIPWCDELTRFVFCEARALCKQREKETGFSWHVDHILPLNGEIVSGFHVFNNLQVIPAAVNLSKGNKI